MSDEFDADEFLADATDEHGGGGVLRKKLEQAIALLKEKEKLIQGFQDKEAEKAAEAAWGNVPKEYRALYSGDTKDAKAISAWVEAATTLGVIKADEQADKAAKNQVSEEDALRNEALQQFAGTADMGSDSDTNGLDTWLQQAKQAKTQRASANPNALTELFSKSPFQVRQGGLTVPTQE